ncbi:hypothetical protein NQ318_018542 [Aromia moschata]|uniref:Exuperantia SAM-like domain-containing protein n=1 Tax=Aromia moschata TaxID=1265417 RepID=A0AAV8ZH48_9CUCU|nr:hypothetical protein NQ318_018542 [Aromia moschata]
MVQHESSNSGDESSAQAIPENLAKGIETGKYRLVGWGIDTTGRRLIDEIVQIAAYTPQSKFSQYIMPFADLNPTYSRRHSIRVINTVRYRRLKDLNTNQFVKTKSEISALQDFLQWLETVKGDGRGRRHSHLSRDPQGLAGHAPGGPEGGFSKVVKGFVNGFNIAQAKCANTTKSFSLRVMSKVLLNKEDENFSSAIDRARAADIASHLAQGERLELEGKPSAEISGVEPHLIDFVCPYANPISAEEEEIAVFKKRQNTFRPVFGALLRASRPERQHASHLRRLLAENNINYDKLKEAYETGAKEGLEKVANAKEKDLQELLEILDCFFDPEKKAVQPKATKFFPNNRRRQKSFNKNQSSNSESHSPQRLDGQVDDGTSK